MATNTLAFYCGFLPLGNCELFFREATLKKGKLLVKHVFAVEEIIQADEHRLNAKCVSQVQDNVVYDVRLKCPWPPPGSGCPDTTSLTAEEAEWLERLL
ncbi:hypothetical protein HPB48_015754 [Haemaphysalis longicornis]|uniref:Uncharacterized protein n=1 Tax=Haemaphysalis longicornis TaxID=44386 RepID=A0A9J6H6E8_HAELO|nr:hypothetical protein HPB48_015754 [Haemaphysalis longicornis]